MISTNVTGEEVQWKVLRWYSQRPGTDPHITREKKSGIMTIWTYSTIKKNRAKKMNLESIKSHTAKSPTL